LTIDSKRSPKQGKDSEFFKLSRLTCSQIWLIWLIPPVDDLKSTYLTKLKKQNLGPKFRSCERRSANKIAIAVDARREREREREKEGERWVSGTFVSLLGRMSSLVNWGCRRGWQAHQQLRSLSTVAREFMCKTEGLGGWSHACARRRVMIVVTMLVMLVQADTTSLYPPKQVQVGAFCLFVCVRVSVC